ncbi:MAG: ankyrin repeat domain-containing protein [Proteobacteria bacterium]|nr:ankyrin repeat domain-containing protein [Pseudomonadota bacterium]
MLTLNSKTGLLKIDTPNNLQIISPKIVDPLIAKNHIVTFLNANTHADKLSVLGNIQHQFGMDALIDNQNNTFLHYLLPKMDLYCVQILVSHYQLNLHCPNLFGETPLDKAAAENREKLRICLQLQGINLNNTIDLSDLNLEGGTVVQINHHASFAVNNIKLIKCENDFNQFIVALNNRGIGLLSSIDIDGNSILHLLIVSGCLETWQIILKYVNPVVFEFRNDSGVTPAELALLCKRIDLFNLLQAHGVKVNISCTLTFALIPKAVDKYQMVKNVLDDSLITLNIADSVKYLLQSGFRLDEPVLNDNKGSVLHWLMAYAPFSELQKILESRQYSTLDPQDQDGVTPLMIAAAHGRQKSIWLLISMGASIKAKDHQGFDIHAYAREFPHFIYLTPMPMKIPLSQGESLYRWVCSQGGSKIFCKLNDKIITLFNLYIKFMQQQKWTYHGHPSIAAKQCYDRLCNLPYVLDCQENSFLTVNCYDVATGFGYLLKMFGIDKVNLHVYKMIRSKPFVPKDPQIKGQFVCFDNKAHLDTFQMQNYYSFTQHCVLYSHGMYYDPSFCCYYENASDVECKPCLPLLPMLIQPTMPFQSPVPTLIQPTVPPQTSSLPQGKLPSYSPPSQLMTEPQLTTSLPLLPNKSFTPSWNAQANHTQARSKTLIKSSPNTTNTSRVRNTLTM